MIQKEAKVLNTVSAQEFEQQLNELLKDDYEILSSGVTIGYADGFQFTKFFAVLQKESEDGYDPFTELI